MKTLNSVVFAAALAVGAAYAAPSGATDVPPAAKKLIPAAQAEGTFHITWGGSTLGGSQGARNYEAGFNRFYGTSVKFSFTPGLSFPAMANKIAEEQAAGKKSFNDLGLAGIGQTGFFISRKSLGPVDWAELVPHIDAATLKKMVSPDGSMISFIGRITTIVYNTNFVKPADAPKRLSDLLNPKWKGRVASTPYAAGFGPLAAHPDWSDDKVIAFAKQLAPQLSGLMRCGEYERVTSGEFWIFAIECEPGIAQLAVQRGAPLGQNMPLDMLQIDHWWLGVPKNAQSPNIAKLFIAWILTQEGQKVLRANQGNDLNYLPGSETAKEIAAAAKEAGQAPDDMDIHKLLAQKNRDKVAGEVAKIFRESRR